MKKDTSLVRNLLKAEKYKFRFLEASLTQAAAAGNVDVVQLLLDHVNSGDVTAALWVVFSAAAKAGKDEFMRLTDAIKLRDTSVPSEALHWAAWSGRSEYIKPLMDNGAEINGDLHGRRALHAAAKNGQLDCLTTLIEHGADVNAGAGRATPLHSAAM